MQKLIDVFHFACQNGAHGSPFFECAFEVGLACFAIVNESMRRFHLITEWRSHVLYCKAVLLELRIEDHATASVVFVC